MSRHVAECSGQAFTPQNFLLIMSAGKRKALFGGWPPQPAQQHLLAFPRFRGVRLEAMLLIPGASTSPTPGRDNKHPPTPAMCCQHVTKHLFSQDEGVARGKLRDAKAPQKCWLVPEDAARMLLMRRLGGVEDRCGL